MLDVLVAGRPLSFRELLFPEIDSSDASGNAAQSPNQHTESTSGNNVAVQAGSSAVLSVELTAAPARYQRALARAPLAAASRANTPPGSAGSWPGWAPPAATRTWTVIP